MHQEYWESKHIRNYEPHIVPNRSLLFWEQFTVMYNILLYYGHTCWCVILCKLIFLTPNWSDITISLSIPLEYLKERFFFLTTFSKKVT